MYRDDPLDDEMELRELIGDEAVNALRAADDEHDLDALDTALDILRILQGWVDDEEAAGWFSASQRRLEGRTPVAALTEGDTDEALAAAQAWAAARG